MVVPMPSSPAAAPNVPPVAVVIVYGLKVDKSCNCDAMSCAAVLAASPTSLSSLTPKAVRRPPRPPKPAKTPRLISKYPRRSFR